MGFILCHFCINSIINKVFKFDIQKKNIINYEMEIIKFNLGTKKIKTYTLFSNSKNLKKNF